MRTLSVESPSDQKSPSSSAAPNAAPSSGWSRRLRTSSVDTLASAEQATSRHDEPIVLKGGASDDQGSGAALDAGKRLLEQLMQHLADPIADRRGTKIARVALARRILTLAFYALRDERGCREYPALPRPSRRPVTARSQSVMASPDGRSLD